MGASSHRVIQWLGDIQSPTTDTEMIPTEPHDSTKTVTASHKSTPSFEPLSPTFFLIPSDSQQDQIRKSAVEDSAKLLSVSHNTIRKDTRAKPHLLSSGHSEVARLRELGLIATKDFDRSNSIKIADSIIPDYSISPREDPSQLRPGLVRRNALYPRRDSEDEELGTPDNSEQETEEACDYKYATAPYLGETLKLTLVTDLDDGALDRKTARWQLSSRSYKLARKIFHNSHSSEEPQPQKFTYERNGAADPPNGPFKFLKPRLRRACPTLAPGKFLHGKSFDPTASESSNDTADTSCTGDGKVMDMRESAARRTPEFHNGNPRHIPQPQTAQIEGTFGHDGDIQVPIFPYPQRSTRCRALTCPIKGKHEKGPYLHEGKLRVREGNIFGSSNPPQQIWEAYDRIKDDDGGLGGKGKDGVAARDVKIVTSFASHHFGEAVEWGVGGLES